MERIIDTPEPEPENDKGWIEYGLHLLWSEVYGYEDVAEKGFLETEELRARVAELEAERNTIANHIRVTLEDGTAPDNLADHVLLLMLQEYDPMMKQNNGMRNRIAELEHIETVAKDVNEWLKQNGMENTGHQRSLEAALRGEVTA